MTEKPIWTWTKGKQGDWLVKGPKLCPICNGTGSVTQFLVGVKVGAEEDIVKPCFACTQGKLNLPIAVNVTAKSGKVSTPVINKCIWSSNVENVALYTTVNPSPVSIKTYTKKDSKWEEDIPAHSPPAYKAAKAYHEAKEELTPKPIKPEPIIEPEPLVEPEPIEPTENHPKACANCSVPFPVNSKHRIAIDRDGIRGAVCSKCFGLNPEERDYQ